jgi:hypothetical protein
LPVTCMVAKPRTRVHDYARRHVTLLPSTILRLGILDRRRHVIGCRATCLTPCICPPPTRFLRRSCFNSQPPMSVPAHNTRRTSCMKSSLSAPVVLQVAMRRLWGYPISKKMWQWVSAGLTLRIQQSKTKTTRCSLE